jgi:hypothetical protein
MNLEELQQEIEDVLQSEVKIKFDKKTGKILIETNLVEDSYGELIDYSDIKDSDDQSEDDYEEDVEGDLIDDELDDE